MTNQTDRLTENMAFWLEEREASRAALQTTQHS